jgi:hypothetical protein
MTAHEIKIARRILDWLHDQDGGQAHALTIHAEIGGLALCHAAEFDEVLQQLEHRRYIIGVKTKFKGHMWNISDAGESARLEMA